MMRALGTWLRLRCRSWVMGASSCVVLISLCGLLRAVRVSAMVSVFPGSDVSAVDMPVVALESKRRVTGRITALKVVPPNETHMFDFEFLVTSNEPTSFEPIWLCVRSEVNAFVEQVNVSRSGATSVLTLLAEGTFTFTTGRQSKNVLCQFVTTSETKYQSAAFSETQTRLPTLVDITRQVREVNVDPYAAVFYPIGDRLYFICGYHFQQCLPLPPNAAPPANALCHHVTNPAHRGFEMIKTHGLDSLNYVQWFGKWYSVPADSSLHLRGMNEHRRKFDMLSRVLEKQELRDLVENTNTALLRAEVEVSYASAVVMLYHLRDFSWPREIFVLCASFLSVGHVDVVLKTGPRDTAAKSVAMKDVKMSGADGSEATKLWLRSYELEFVRAANANSVNFNWFKDLCEDRWRTTAGSGPENTRFSSRNQWAPLVSDERFSRIQIKYGFEFPDVYAAFLRCCHHSAFPESRLVFTNWHMDNVDTEAIDSRTTECGELVSRDARMQLAQSEIDDAVCIVLEEDADVRNKFVDSYAKQNAPSVFHDRLTDDAAKYYDAKGREHASKAGMQPSNKFRIPRLIPIANNGHRHYYMFERPARSPRVFAFGIRHGDLQLEVIAPTLHHFLVRYFSAWATEHRGFSTARDHDDFDRAWPADDASCQRYQEPAADAAPFEIPFWQKLIVDEV